MSEELKQVDTETGISITLNGGKKEMNSATIPIEWWFSREVIEKDPKYLLFFEQNEREKSDKWRNGNYGRRYACEVSDVFKFLELFSPGYHRIVVIAIAGKEKQAEEFVKKYLKTESRDYYSASLNWEDTKSNTKMDNLKEMGDYHNCSLVSAIEEFEVPEELFAKKPETKFSKAVWKWTNLWHENEPENECAYRKRKLFAFTLQPPLALMGWLVVYGIGGTVYSAYILLASLAVFFVGYRPRSILKEMWRAFTFKRYKEWEVRKYENWESPSESAYRFWSVGKEKDAKYMPVITPLLATLIGGAGIGLYYIIKVLLPFMPPLVVCLSIIAVLAFTGLTVYLISSRLKKTAPERKKKRQQKEKERQQAFEKENKEWLENFDLSKKTDEVYLDRLPVPTTFSGKVVQKFRVSYWTRKAEVCKPYSR